MKRKRSATLCIQLVRLAYPLFQVAFKELSQTNAFAFNEPVETMDYDQYKSRLVVCSHFGKIKMLSVEKDGMVMQLGAWNRSTDEI